MERIYELYGSATELNWPNLKQWEEFKPRRHYERILIKHIQNVCQALNKQIDHLLILDPNKRLNAIQALNHEFFKQDPKLCQPNEMHQFEKDFHETLIKNENEISLTFQQLQNNNTTLIIQRVNLMEIQELPLQHRSYI